jgi:hypothetical protein
MVLRKMRGYERGWLQTRQLPRLQRHARNKILLAIAKTVAPNAEKATLLGRLSERIGARSRRKQKPAASNKCGASVRATQRRFSKMIARHMRRLR